MTSTRGLRLVGVLLIALLSVILPLAALAQSETPVAPVATEEPAAEAPVALVTVNGTVTNGTAGSAVPADLAVLLRVISPDMSETILPTTINADGTFTVPDVPIYSDHMYVVTAEHQGAVFSGDLVAGLDLNAAPTLPLTIYDVSDDASAIAIEALQTQVAVSLNEMQVLALYQFSNSGDTAYVAPDGASVRINVPEGAQIYDMGTARFLISDDGRQLIDQAAVLPGNEHTVHVLYTMPYGGEATVRHSVNYPLLNGFEVVITAPGLTVSGDGMAPVGGTESGMAFGVSASIPAGGDVVYTVSGVPETTAGTTSDPTTAGSTAAASGSSFTIPPLSVILMVFGGACVGVALVLFVRDRRKPAPAPAAEPVDPRVNALVQQIAELDVTFQAGGMSKDDYDTQRAALKAELMSLARDGADQ